MTALRTNWKNDGRAFQEELRLTAGAYAARGIATLEKVDPPTRIFGRGGDQKMLYMTNPFLDFVGIWSARGGRLLMVEAKSTQDPRLQFNGGGNFTEKQWNAMKRWRVAGAACALLWQHAGRVSLFPPEALLIAETAGARSILHGEGWRVPRGEGAIVWDFLPVLAAACWNGAAGLVKTNADQLQMRL